MLLAVAAQVRPPYLVLGWQPRAAAADCSRRRTCRGWNPLPRPAPNSRVHSKHALGASPACDRHNCIVYEARPGRRFRSFGDHLFARTTCCNLDVARGVKDVCVRKDLVQTCLLNVACRLNFACTRTSTRCEQTCVCQEDLHAREVVRVRHKCCSVRREVVASHIICVTVQLLEHHLQPQVRCCRSCTGACTCSWKMYGRWQHIWNTSCEV